MSVTSKKETILDYIRATVLPKIDGTGDYNLNVTNISRNFRHYNELDGSEFPALYIVDSEVTIFTPRTARGFTTGGSLSSITDGWIVQIWGYVKITEQNVKTGVLEQEMNKLMSDVMIAMASDHTFNGTALGSVLISNHNSTEFSEDSGVGIVLQRYSIKYDFSPAASTPVT